MNQFPLTDLHKAMARPLKELVIHMKVIAHSRQPQNSAGIFSFGAARITRSPMIDGTCSRFNSVCSLMSCRTPRPLGYKVRRPSNQSNQFDYGCYHM